MVQWCWMSKTPGRPRGRNRRPHLTVVVNFHLDFDASSCFVAFGKAGRLYPAAHPGLLLAAIINDEHLADRATVEGINDERDTHKVILTVSANEQEYPEPGQVLISVTNPHPAYHRFEAKRHSIDASGGGLQWEGHSFRSTLLKVLEWARAIVEGTVAVADSVPSLVRSSSEGRQGHSPSWYGPRWEDIDLDWWLKALVDPATNDDMFVDCQFPNAAVRSAYLETVVDRSEDDVRTLLRYFLIPSGEFGSDAPKAARLKELLMDGDPDQFAEAMRIEYYRRLAGIAGSMEPTWQGLTWVLDLLPGWPQKAIDVVEAYWLAHLEYLPDGRLWGLVDAQAVIRAKWIGDPLQTSVDALFGLGSRRFEHLVNTLYRAMGFESELTPPQKDGGRDLIVTVGLPGRREQSRVECKLWRRPVSVSIVRALLGVVEDEKATKGTLICTGGFTRPAVEFARRNARLELIGWQELVALLNEYFGAEWTLHVDYLVARSMKR